MSARPPKNTNTSPTTAAQNLRDLRSCPILVMRGILSKRPGRARGARPGLVDSKADKVYAVPRGESIRGNKKPRRDGRGGCTICGCAGGLPPSAFRRLTLERLLRLLRLGLRLLHLGRRLAHPPRRPSEG